jgi:hypothetical protein
MKNNYIKLLFIISIILFCAFAVMRWLFNDHEFRYGDLNYYLLTDQKIRCFPIIGAKPSAVFYKSYFQDGTSPGMLKMTYNSSMTPQEAIKAFKKACIRLGYTPDHPHFTGYKFNHRGVTGCIGYQIVNKGAKRFHINIVFTY